MVVKALHRDLKSVLNLTVKNVKTNSPMAIKQHSLLSTLCLSD